MPETIHGDAATGGIHPVGVTADNQLKTFSVARDIFTQINIEGDAYNINTGDITLTNTTQTPVLYLKNNETKDLVVTAIAVGLGTSAGGTATEAVKVHVIRNPTVGTIVDNATSVDINSNRNYGSTNTLTVDAYKGATGNTMTDGDNHIEFYQPDFGRLFAGVDEIIPKGRSIGVKITPPTGNTGLELYVALICHLVKEV